VAGRRIPAPDVDAAVGCGRRHAGRRRQLL